MQFLYLLAATGVLAAPSPAEPAANIDAAAAGLAPQACLPKSCTSFGCCSGNCGYWCRACSIKYTC